MIPNEKKRRLLYCVASTWQEESGQRIVRQRREEISLDEGFEFEQEYFPYLFNELFQVMLPKDMGNPVAAFSDQDAPHILSVEAYAANR